MIISLDKFLIIKFLIGCALLLILIHSTILGIYYYIGNPEVFDFVRLFDLDMERNIPTLFSSALLLIAGFLFFLLSKSSREGIQGKHKYWLGLSVVFVFLAFDEGAKIHEQLGDLTKQLIDVGGYLYYPWVLLYGVFVLLLAMIYLRFFIAMPRKVFFAFMGAAILYLSGAIGFELLGANEASQHGTTTILYSIYYTIEESLEMFGVIYLIYILLGLLASSSLVIEE